MRNEQWKSVDVGVAVPMHTKHNYTLHNNFLQTLRQHTVLKGGTYHLYVILTSFGGGGVRHEISHSKRFITFYKTSKLGMIILTKCHIIKLMGFKMK